MGGGRRVQGGRTSRGLQGTGCPGRATGLYRAGARRPRPGLSPPSPLGDACVPLCRHQEDVRPCEMVIPGTAGVFPTLSHPGHRALSPAAGSPSVARAVCARRINCSPSGHRGPTEQIGASVEGRTMDILSPLSSKGPESLRELPASILQHKGRRDWGAS